MKIEWPEGLKGSELFRYIKANKSAILHLKKSETKRADCISVTITSSSFKSISKGQYLFSDDEPNGILQRTLVINSYNWLDSHDDVHQNNLFAKSIKEQPNAPHLHDHIFQLDARVGLPISWSENQIPWKELGVDLDGNTQALILESKIMKEMNKSVYKDYLAGRIDQHSVGMQYVRLEMAINDPDYEEEYKAWQSTFDKLGNKQKAIDQGYYFPVYEAKRIEGSAVLLGSNELTPTLGNKFQPPSSTEKDQPVHIPLNIEEMVGKFYKL